MKGWQFAEICFRWKANEKLPVNKKTSYDVKRGGERMGRRASEEGRGKGARVRKGTLVRMKTSETMPCSFGSLAAA